MRGLLAGCGIVAIGLISLQIGQVGAQEDASKPEFYTAKVKPIFDENCGRCHEGVNHRGGLNIDTRENLLKGGKDGPAIVPGDPANSLLVKLIRHEGPADDPMNMPPNKPKISDADIATVTAWVKAGAVMPPPAP
jgi:mono/diheme cytochrome c family protein